MEIPVVVVQRHRDNLTGIKNCVKKLNPSLAEEIFYTNNPDQVLRFSENKDTLFVVSGQIFVPEECGGGNICRGTHLARLVKKRCEKALFFIYSTMPEMNEYVDGVISKGYGTINSGEHGNLAETLCHLDTFVSNLKDQDVKNILRVKGEKFCEFKKELNSVLFGAE